MTAIVEVFARRGPVVTENYMEAMHTRSPSMKKVGVLEVEAAGQMFGNVESFVYLCGVINGIAEVTPEVNRRNDHAWKCSVK